MKRALLLCLFALTACRTGDPKGTLQPDAQGRTGAIQAAPGDSAPFRLSGGDMAFDLILQQAGAWRECAAQLTLIPYGESAGRPLGSPGAIFQTVRVNGVQAGVYFLRNDAGRSDCRLIVTARRT